MLETSTAINKQLRLYALFKIKVCYPHKCQPVYDVDHGYLFNRMEFVVESKNSLEKVTWL